MNSPCALTVNIVENAKGHNMETIISHSDFKSLTGKGLAWTGKAVGQRSRSLSAGIFSGNFLPLLPGACYLVEVLEWRFNLFPDKDLWIAGELKAGWTFYCGIIAVILSSLACVCVVAIILKDKGTSA